MTFVVVLLAVLLVPMWFGLVVAERKVRESAMRSARERTGEFVLHSRVRRNRTWLTEIPGSLDLRGKTLVFTPRHGPAETWDVNDFRNVHCHEFGLKFEHGGETISFRFGDRDPRLPNIPLPISRLKRAATWQVALTESRPSSFG